MTLVEMGTYPLTARQKELYDYLAERIQGGLPPTVREIGKKMEINSPNGVLCHLIALEKKGFITRDRYRSRSIRLVQYEPRVCPNCGHDLSENGQEG